MFLFIQNRTPKAPKYIEKIRIIIDKAEDVIALKTFSVVPKISLNDRTG